MQTRPSVERMETESSFIAKPALVYLDIPAADRPINLSVRGSVAGNTATDRARGVIDAQVAARAASGANRICTFEKPNTDFESKIYAGQSSNWTDIDDIH